MTAEIDIQNAIRREVAKRGHFIYRANVGKVRMQDGRWFDTGLPSGFPDLFGFRRTDKQIFFIEVKNERGRPRKVQIQFHKFLEKQNVIHGIARSAEDALNIVENGLIGHGF